MGAPRIPVADRIHDKYVVDTATGCWTWTAAIGAGGYGRVDADGRNQAAHRVMYELLVEPIADGLVLDHLCRNRACVNPDHLEPVTTRENILRGEGIAARRARASDCDHGHPFTPANTRIRPNGTRYCRTCDRDRKRIERSAA